MRFVTRMVLNDEYEIGPHDEEYTLEEAKRDAEKMADAIRREHLVDVTVDYVRLEEGE